MNKRVLSSIAQSQSPYPPALLLLPPPITILIHHIKERIGSYHHRGRRHRTGPGRRIQRRIRPFRRAQKAEVVPARRRHHRLAGRWFCWTGEIVPARLGSRGRRLGRAREIVAARCCNMVLFLDAAGPGEDGPQLLLGLPVAVEVLLACLQLLFPPVTTTTACLIEWWVPVRHRRICSDPDLFGRIRNF